jgi:nitrate reductase beta subunit
VPVAVETFHALQQRQKGEPAAAGGQGGHGGHRRGRVNLLNWDGTGTPPGLFPESRNGVGGQDW